MEGTCYKLELFFQDHHTQEQVIAFGVAMQSDFDINVGPNSGYTLKWIRISPTVFTIVLDIDIYYVKSLARSSMKNAAAKAETWAPPYKLTKL